MLAVSNTSPLFYLVAVGQADLLAHLFGSVLIPPGVATELADPARPSIVRNWIASPPGWLTVQALVSLPDAELSSSLDLGEREAIQLTVESRADVLVMDERKGRAIAQQRGLPLIGALGVLGQTYQRGFLDDPLTVLNAMRRHGFRVGDALVGRFEVLLKTRYSR
jgi:predicted nucleic acid-binding protein